jgi:hypothetical protein
MNVAGLASDPGGGVPGQSAEGPQLLRPH